MNDTQGLSRIIYNVRDKNVMLDSDLAKVFNMETRVLNQLVKRNLDEIKRENYFQLNDEELNNLKSQFVTSSSWGGRRTNPYVFTLEGIEILTSFIRSANLNEIMKNIRIAFESQDVTLSSNGLEIPENTGYLKDKIYFLRGKYVMLDFDLAVLYECQNGTKTINLAVKRNEEKFMERHMFQLTKEEAKSLSRFQFETLNNKRGHNVKYLPYAFTESGVVMLSTILNTSVASSITVRIVDEFMAMRRYISGTLLSQEYLNDLLLKDHKLVLENKDRIDDIQKYINKMEKAKVVNEIYFAGQIYDAYSKIKDIINKAKKELIIVDAYADKSVLDMVKDSKAFTYLLVKPNGLLNSNDIEAYNKQYSNLKVVYTKDYHDRYFIIDRKIVYHCGASINHAGSKTFSINILEDKIVKSSLIKEIASII